MEMAFNLVAFESRKLEPAERNYPAHEREMLAVIYALRKWKCYLLGPLFTILTDNRAITYCQTQKEMSKRMTRWTEFLQEYTFEFKHQSGKNNVVADSLSRAPHVNHIVAPATTVTNVLVEDYEDWPLLVPEYNRSKSFPPHIPESTRQRVVSREAGNFSIGDDDSDIRYKSNQGLASFVPFSKRYDYTIQIHSGLGRFGEKATLDLMKERVWWPRMARDVKLFVSGCPECQKNKPDPLGHKKEKLHPLQPAPGPFQRWALDFIGELPTTRNNNKWIITGICHTTNWPIARAVPDAREETLANFIYEEIFMRFGCPVEILTDRGSNFMAGTLNAYLRKQKTKHLVTSAYHPRTNGKNEKIQRHIW